MPVDGGGLVQLVLKHHAHGVALPGLEHGAGKLAVVGHDPGGVAVCQLNVHLTCHQVVLHHVVVGFLVDGGGDSPHLGQGHFDCLLGLGRTGNQGHQEEHGGPRMRVSRRVYRLRPDFANGIKYFDIS